MNLKILKVDDTNDGFITEGCNDLLINLYNVSLEMPIECRLSPFLYITQSEK